MPAFHRMPVVYLALAALTAVGWLSLRPTRPESRDPSPSAPGAEAAAATTEPGALPAPPAPAPEPEDGILRDADGLRRKVVVRALGLTPRSEPDGGVAVGSPLDYFSIHYIFETDSANPPRAVRIGPRTGPPIGWVPTDAVLEWDTRLMARPTPRAGRPRLVLYRERGCLFEALAGRTCPRHGASCPTEGEEPDSALDTPAAGLPILRSLAVPQPDGTSRTVFEVASLVQDRAPITPPVAPLAADLPALRTIDLAFVIDTTASMQATLDGARDFAAALVREAARRDRDVTLRLALVEYRDAAPLYGFRTRVVTRFTDPAGFRRALDRLAVARGGDGSVDEQVLDGVQETLDHLDWPVGRAGELATKLIVLIGDAPDHARDLDRARALAEQARGRRITIATVAIDRTGRSADEERRYRAQWQALAEGSYRPLDPRQRFEQPIPPIRAALGQEADLAPRLEALLADRVEHARQLAALAAAEAEQRLQEYVTSQGLTLRQVHPVLVDLHRGEDRPRPRSDPRFGGRKAPSVRRGWIAQAQDGQPLVTVAMLLTRAELDALIEELLSVQQAVESPARDLRELIQVGTAAATGETDFLAADRGGLTFSEHLRRRQGLPPPRPDSLLQRTQTDLLQADDLTRQLLRSRLAECLARLIERRGEPDWNDPTRLIDGMALVPYDWIDF